ncbi:MAG TPA: hypothetical protein VHY33_08340 [Thermoanaerobaculia bacterium]|jgi:hypothetical protein|nr:hypothetical protein [Thermoanaerobaculia bacterium]
MVHVRAALAGAGGVNVVIDRPEARRLPSRHRFALARLIAYAKLRGASAAVNHAERLILPIDRDQTAAEMHGMAIWIFVTTVCYVAAMLPMIWPVAIVAAVPIAAIALHFPIVVIGPIVRLLIGDGDHVKIISVFTMALLVIASSYIAASHTWARYVAWLFFAVFILNAAAAAVAWLLRDRIRAAEERCAR